MTYSKPQVEIIRFEENGCFMTYSSIVHSYGSEGEARAAAIAAMGWSTSDYVVAQKDYSGNWMAYCAVVNGQGGGANQYGCTSF